MADFEDGDLEITAPSRNRVDPGYAEIIERRKGIKPGLLLVVLAVCIVLIVAAPILWPLL